VLIVGTIKQTGLNVPQPKHLKAP